MPSLFMLLVEIFYWVLITLGGYLLLIAALTSGAKVGLNEIIWMVPFIFGLWWIANTPGIRHQDARRQRALLWSMILGLVSLTVLSKLLLPFIYNPSLLKALANNASVLPLSFYAKITIYFVLVLIASSCILEVAKSGLRPISPLMAIGSVISLLVAIVLGSFLLAAIIVLIIVLVNWLSSRGANRQANQPANRQGAQQPRYRVRKIGGDKR